LNDLLSYYVFGTWYIENIRALVKLHKIYVNSELKIIIIIIIIYLFIYLFILDFYFFSWIMTMFVENSFLEIHSSNYFYSLYQLYAGNKV
jgi:hypothetical protein